MSKDTTKQIERVFEISHAWCKKHIDRAVFSERRSHASLNLSRNLKEQGWDGTAYHQGLRVRSQDTPEFDHPYVARGLGYDLGVLERLVRTSPQYQRILENVDQLIIGAIFETTAPKRAALEFPAMADVLAETVAESHATMQGGLQTLIREAAYSLLTGAFSIHHLIDRENGRLKKAAMRRTNTVDHWLFNETGQDFVAIEHRDQNGGRYVVPVEHTLIVQWRPIGMDIESYGPARVSAPWIVAKQMLAQNWHGRMSKYAMPVIWIEESEDRSTEDGDLLVNLFDEFEAEDFPVITGKKGQKATALDLGGQASEFEAALKYCDEQILMPLGAEVALLGLNKVGAYNLAESKDATEMAIAISVVQRIVDAINGVNNQPWTGLNKRIIHNTWGTPVYPGDYPETMMSAGEDEAPIEDIFSAVDRGLLDVTPELQEHIAKRLKVPQPPPENDDDEAKVHADNVQDTALNGAQIKSLVEIAQFLDQGSLGKSAALGIVKRAFNVSEQEARDMLGLNQDTL